MQRDTANPRYCPTEWLDEINPLGNTPEAFVRRDGERWITIDPDEEEGSEAYFKGEIEPGQLVNFARLTTYDDFILTIQADGSHYADLPQFDGHPGFRLEDWEYEDVVDELSELIRIGATGDTYGELGHPLTSGTYTVECWAWRDTIPYRFEPHGATPKFVLCAGAN
jgi:hypothetical protein